MPGSPAKRDRSSACAATWSRKSGSTASRSRSWATGGRAGPRAEPSKAEPSDLREHLAGIEDAERVESVLHRHLDSTGSFVEFVRQPGALEVADPVLAGDRAAELDADAHDLLEYLLRGRRRGLVAGVEEHRGVHVPVTGMRHQRDLESGGFPQGAQPVAELGHGRARQADIVEQLT